MSAAGQLAILCLAVALHAASLLLWSAVWAALVAAAAPGSAASSSGSAERGTPGQPASSPRPHALAVSLASLLGMLTPWNVGTDVLRSYLGRRELGLDVARTAAASVVTRALKLHVLLVAIAPLGWFALHAPDPRRWAGKVAALVAAALVLQALGWRRLGGLTRRLGVGDLPRAVRDTRRTLSVGRRASAYAAFATALVLEAAALAACLRIAGLRLDFTATAAVFGLVYGLSRTALTPQGLGVAELGGFAMLRGMGFPAGAVTLALFVWAVARSIAPLLLAAAAARALSTFRGRRNAGLSPIR